MKLLTCFAACILFSFAVNATMIKGLVKNAKNESLSGVSIALLYPQDSTLAYFGITDKAGNYAIANVKSGNYILQAASAGYFIEYKTVSVTASETMQMDDILLAINDRVTNLGEVVVSGEKVPIKIAGDTVEYNAGSFKVKPNAPVEDLLKQLPGIQVDAAGNIKSMGKDVNKVLVDGKEFFGNDPKVATKNLPADAVNKVQTFGKKSDQAEFSGIDDGERDQTINLVLKDGKRTGYFGNVNAAYGTDNRFEGGARIFKFRPKTQIALIGQVNNINNVGFSFSDYLSFNGGLGGLMSGGNFDMDGGMDFGQTVTGDITSGSLGINYTYEPRTGNRLNINYMGDGYKKELVSGTTSQNFLQEETYKTESNSVSNSNNIGNRLSLRWKNQLDSFNQLTMNAKGQIKNNDARSVSSMLSYRDAALENRLNDNTSAKGMTADGTATLNFVHKSNNAWKLLNAKAEVGYSTSINDKIWQNTTRFLNSPSDIYTSQYQNDDNSKFTSLTSLSATRYLGNNLYITPGISGNFNKEVLNRDQGMHPKTGDGIDSLSPHFYNDIYKLQTGVSLKKSASKTQWNVGLDGLLLSMNPVANQTVAGQKKYTYLLPTLYWRRSLSSHRSIEGGYRTKINTPATNQLLPVTYYTSPLSSITGNVNLKPEYIHNANLNYHHFDQFNLSSIFAYVNASYTTNKINTSQTIDAQLRQQSYWVNTPYQALINMRASYERPIKALAIQAGVSLGEAINMSVTPINGLNNATRSYTHTLSLSVNNKHNKVWDVRGELSVDITDAYYSINKERNNRFYNYTGNGSIGYQSKNDKWFAMVSGDVTYYTDRSFDAPITVPLLRAEISRFILANNRGTITLKAFDILDKNRSVLRSSQLNYLMETRSNVIGRYFMLSFNYKLNKTGKGSPGGDIEFSR